MLAFINYLVTHSSLIFASLHSVTMSTRDVRPRRRSRSRSRSRSAKRPNQRATFNPPRVDRHECRRKAIEFLTKWDDSRGYTEGEVESEIARFLRQRPNGWDSLSYGEEILRGLLGPARGLAVADRWIMGILAEDVQKSLGPGELSVLRWAAYELLNHPNLPTTVVINEANQVSKMFCPQQASLIHAAVNRMIETQSSIGAELSAGGVPVVHAVATTEKPASSKFPPLDPQAQMALLLMEQQRKRRRKKERRGDDDESSSSSSSEDDLKINRTANRQPTRRAARFARSKIVDTLTKDQSTQTIANPMTDPNVVVVDAAVYSSDDRD